MNYFDIILSSLLDCKDRDSVKLMEQIFYKSRKHHLSEAQVRAMLHVLVSILNRLIGGTLIYLLLQVLLQVAKSTLCLFSTFILILVLG